MDEAVVVVVVVEEEVVFIVVPKSLSPHLALHCMDASCEMM
jgi:hypothetical protein